MPPEVCPNCGAEIPRRAKSCPECGSDESTGWSDSAAATGLDLPEEEFNYDKFVAEEFGAKKRIKPNGIHWIWWVTALVLLIFFLVIFLR